MKEAYCSFEIAKLLKEKGFDEPCHSFYKLSYNKITHEWSSVAANRNCYESKKKIEYVNAPTHQMATAWLREKGVFIEISVRIDLNGDYHYSYSILDKECKYIREGYTSFEWKYEDAVEVALKYSLENLI